VVQVGIFGDKNTLHSEVEHVKSKKTGKIRPKKVGKSDLMNWELGFIHEYGSTERHIPARSFLNMPLRVKGQEIIAQAGKNFTRFVYDSNPLAFWDDLGRRCYNAVQQAFATRGFGNWATDRPRTVAEKGSDAPLIDTGELRRSVDWRVTKRDS
jgi:hypothetical protein